MHQQLLAERERLREQISKDMANLAVV